MLQGVFLLGLLVVAWFLEPNPQGLGTHQRLGLPPCSSRQLFGIRCPGCGMTTSWAHITKGEFLPALRANISGTLLALIALAGSVWFLLSAAVGRHVTRVPPRKAVWIMGLGVAVIALAQWIYRLAIGM